MFDVFCAFLLGKGAVYSVGGFFGPALRIMVGSDAE